MVDTDDTRRTTDDERRTTPRVWHKLPTGELKSHSHIEKKLISLLPPESDSYSVIDSRSCNLAPSRCPVNCLHPQYESERNLLPNHL